MSDIIEAEHQTMAVATRPAAGAVGQALGVNEILNQVRLIQQVMKEVMQEGEHYGKIPGCGDKKTLLQPGAQKLTMTFRLTPKYELQETNFPGGHKEYRVICTLCSMGDGAFVAQGVGCCSTLEGKYRWRSGNIKCPKCGTESVLKSKNQGEGYFCWVKKNGCGAKFALNDPAITSQHIGKVEYDNPADHFNTVLKMAKKRAFVDATITATAASDIFTQDIGDTEEEPAVTAPQPAPASQTPSPSTTSTSTNPAPAPAPTPVTPPPAAKQATSATRMWMVKHLIDQFNADDVKTYARHFAILMPNEELGEWPLDRVPTTQEDLKNLIMDIEGYLASGAAENAPPAAQPEEAWRSFPVPFGKNSGIPLGELSKNTLFGFWANFKVETTYNGKPRKLDKIEADTEFRKHLDAAGVHYQFTKKD